MLVLPWSSGMVLPWSSGMVLPWSSGLVIPRRSGRIQWGLVLEDFLGLFGWSILPRSPLAQRLLLTNDFVDVDISRGKPFIHKEGKVVIKDSFKSVKNTEVVPLGW
jgi:hypothetical protein